MIELVAVLVIMAIIALIVTPLVMNIIRKARISADKRSVDAYGRSIELAIASYVLDTGKFPTDINQLTIEYRGSDVVCETTVLNNDSSIYLSGCRVAGRSVGDYVYGKLHVVTYDVYEIGDEIRYNNVYYRVIKTSGTSDANVTLLKSEPLTVAEVNSYGVGHINRYIGTTNIGNHPQGTVYNQNGYGGMAYYTSETCGYVNNSFVFDGCTTDYAQSEVKYVVDAWKSAQASGAIEARLITYDELVDNLGYDHASWSVSHWLINPEYTPNWLYNSNYRYWTMSPRSDAVIMVWNVGNNGALYNGNIYYDLYAVRPVIVLPKSALE